MHIQVTERPFGDAQRLHLASSHPSALDADSIVLEWNGKEGGIVGTSDVCSEMDSLSQVYPL
jgi:hypothetical protein